MEEDQLEEVLGLQEALSLEIGVLGLQEALSLEIGVLGGQYLETVTF